MNAEQKNRKAIEQKKKSAKVKKVLNLILSETEETGKHLRDVLPWYCERYTLSFQDEDAVRELYFEL